MSTAKSTIRLAALGDLHCRAGSQGKLAPILAQAAAQADVLVLCGDLTDFGKVEEAQVLAKELMSAANIPMVGVLGNHDYESNQVAEVRAILCEAGLNLLDGDVFEAHDVGFAGVKGFAGGFGQGMLRPFGEPSIKAFVHEAIDEALKLECALGSLRTEHRIAITHYAPIEATIVGERPEIFPYLGTSRLEDSLQRYPVHMAFHGHAHCGTLEGRTSSGVPVFNVAMPLLLRQRHQAFRIFELQPTAAEHPREATAQVPQVM
ncbi:MAG TPA: metallophosphoesterase [Polyangiales bacterium]|nr:metallophosphoesterase [Polyangiales bacterium]